MFEARITTQRIEEAVNAMLLNEFLKEHRKGQEQDAAIATLTASVAKQERFIAEQQKEIRQLTVTLKEQAGLIRKVNDQVEMSKARPQLVADAQ